MMFKRIFIIFSALMLVACSANSHSQQAVKQKEQYSNSEQLTRLISSLKTNQPNNVNNETSVKSAQLNKIYKQWVGTRYRLGGDDKRGIDCSAFMQQTFSQVYGIELPRSTAQQRNIGTKIQKNELKQGDLVFFRGNRHVGVYLGNGKFMHASTSQGVTISSMNEQYWARTYTQSRRIL